MNDTFKKKAPGIIRRLMADFKLLDYQAAGILGNLGVESAGLTIMQELHPVSGRGGFGWAQWTGPRRREFEGWCKHMGLAPTSDEANYGFLKVELSDQYKESIVRLRKTASVEDASDSFERAFERAGVPALAARRKWARDALAAYRASKPAPGISVAKPRLPVGPAAGVVVAASWWSQFPHHLPYILLAGLVVTAGLLLWREYKKKHAPVEQTVEPAPAEPQTPVPEPVVSLPTETPVPTDQKETASVVSPDQPKDDTDHQPETKPDGEPSVVDVAK